MTAIWQDDGSQWWLFSPAGFSDEAALHGLVEQAPHTLPARRQSGPRGAPLLDGNGADLIALDRNGK